MKRVIIVHSWGAKPSENWYPWLKKELETLGFSVEVPEMPDTDNPKIEEWVPALKDKVGTPDSDTYLVGHSVGCQTILRYLETINTKIGSVVLVAPWLILTLGDEEDMAIAKPWIETPLHWNKIKTKADKFYCIFSDDDPYVPIINASKFRSNLEAEVIIEKGKGHLSEEHGVMEAPFVLKFFKKVH